ncbi:hypothetical protein L798_13551 [Zootermopsis nevadensis]|uniref:Uncharacterized protein n=1 Tax=Zootermopsis nevadensis TaxID=136037 RepID=A0A067QSP5_ZOONE|nr:hypothetical protein L798_13551 [Zootermopsis nevadensis]
MCFGKVFVTLLTLPWLNNAMNRHEIKLFSGNNTVLILYKTPPDRPHHQLSRVLEHIQQEVAQHASTCTPGETGICIITTQVRLQQVHCFITGSPGEMGIVYCVSVNYLYDLHLLLLTAYLKYIPANRINSKSFNLAPWLQPTAHCGS